MGYRGINKTANDSRQLVIASAVTQQAVSEPFRLTREAAIQGLRVTVKVSGVTVVGAIALVMQELIHGTWTAIGAPKTVSITGNGNFSWRIMSTIATTDNAYMPLTDTVRACITTTNAGDRITVDEVIFYA
jgi:hypothetical protein